MKNSDYVYGNTARNLYVTQPARHTDYDHEIEIRRRAKVKPKRKIDRGAVVIASITLVIAFFVCFSYLQKQFQTTYMSKNLVSLENQVVELQKQNAESFEKLGSQTDLTQIYQKATKELGMIHAKNNQIFTYESARSNQVKQYGDIPSR